MNTFIPALYTETIKTLKSKVLWITMIFFVFIGAMMGVLMMVAKNPEMAGGSAIMSTKASFVSEASWPAFFVLLQQLVLVLSMIGPGVVIIWLFGREYSDRTLKEIMSLPVSRTSIVAAKFLIGFIWSLILIILMVFASVITGSLAGLTGWSEIDVVSFSGSLILISVLTILLTTPFAFITCASRGLLLPVAMIILIMIITQFLSAGFPEATLWFPWAIPALLSGVAGDLLPHATILSYIILALTAAMGAFATAMWWKYTDHH